MHIMKRWICLILVLVSLRFTVYAIDYDEKFREYGFVDIQESDSSIDVDLRYASDENFIGINMYGDFHRAYLHPEVASRLVKAQKLLKNIDSEYSLIVYDAARPRSVQKLMYDKVRGTEFSKYVASPDSGGGFHNYGCAVDVTILHKGEPLDMGSEFDDFSELSHTDNEESNVLRGILSPDAYKNRKLLRIVMTNAGFDVEPCEWWHFSCYDKSYVVENFKLLDF